MRPKIDKKIFFLLNKLVGKSKLFDLNLVFWAQYAIFFYLAFLGLLFSWPLLAFTLHLTKGEIFITSIVGILGWCLALLIKALNFTSRPYINKKTKVLIKKKKTSSAFPSGHTTLMFVLGTMFFYFNPVLGISTLFIGLFIGFSRLTSGLHWPIDILGGAVLGWLVSFIVQQSLYF